MDFGNFHEQIEKLIAENDELEIKHKNLLERYALLKVVHRELRDKYLTNRGITIQAKEGEIEALKEIINNLKEENVSLEEKRLAQKKKGDTFKEKYFYLLEENVGLKEKIDDLKKELRKAKD